MENGKKEKGKRDNLQKTYSTTKSGIGNVQKKKTPKMK